jgi:hypothetical protein
MCTNSLIVGVVRIHIQGKARGNLMNDSFIRMADFIYYKPNSEHVNKCLFEHFEKNNFPLKRL